MSALSTPLGITLFRDAGASTADPRMLSLTDLADMARNTIAPTKAALPWMKAADFGTARTEKNSLRHNANVLGLNGIEADYDGERLSIEDAAGLLRKAGLAALVYSSPSHLPDLPRWRVVCPLSTRLPPAARTELVGKLNGVLGGVLARESFTLSQGFFIGQTPDSLAPETALIPGQYLDLVDGLQPVYPARQASDSIRLPPMQPGTPPDARAQQALTAAVGAFGVRGETDRHHTLLAATNTVAPFVLSGHLDLEDAKDALGQAMSADGRDPNQGEVEGAMSGALRMAVAYLPATGGGEFEALPAPGDEYPLLTPDDCEAEPPRGFLIEGLIAPGDVGCVFGAPGAGKSQLGPYLAYMLAQGRPAFGCETKPGDAWYVAAEDEFGLAQRVKALRRRHGAADGFKLVKGVGDLLNPEAGHAARLVRQVERHRPALVILDTLAAAFSGLDENASQDMGRVVAYARRLAATGAAVILIHHDTKAGTGTPRGHSILNGALDMALQLTKGDDGVIRGKLSKNRNGPCDLDIAFSTDSVLLAEATDGRKKPITAPMVRELAVAADMARGPRLSRQPREALNTLVELSADVAPGADGRCLVAEEAWRAACDDRRVSPSADPKTRREAFAAAFAKLRDGRHVLAGGGNVWLPVLATGFEEMPGEKVSGIAEFRADSAPANRGVAAEEAESALRHSAPPPPPMPGRLNYEIERAGA